MGAQATTAGVSWPSKERRSGKDRRKHIDPRYRNPVYREFVDRRKGEKRKPIYEEGDRFLKEHPIRKWIVVIAIVVTAFLTYIFFFTNFIVSKKCTEERRRKGTITLGYDLANDINPIHQKRLDSTLAAG